jgi:hypothetical protein
MSNEKTPRGIAPRPCTTENERKLDDDRQALRQLIDTFRRQPESRDDGGFYRNMGRFIARPMMKPAWPGDRNN